MKRLIVLGFSFALLSACTTATPGGHGLAERDPLEPFNRGVWDVNQAVDKVAIKPATQVYRTVTPPPARRGLSRIISNLSEPFSFINNLLQGNPDRAARNLGRFLVNTTIGVGGLADHATGMGIAPAPEDFGQTLAAWGANGGPYIVLPLLGPSTLRDGVGSVTSMVADPYSIGIRESGLSSNAQLGIRGAQVINVRSQLTESGADSFLETSLDPYAAARSAFLQRREAEIGNQDDGGMDSGAGEDVTDSEWDASEGTEAVSEMPAETPENSDSVDEAVPADDQPKANAY